MDYTQFYCHECLFAGTSPFCHLLCTKTHIPRSWYEKACEEFKDRYSEIVNDKEV